jgi:hypothetical protein
VALGSRVAAIATSFPLLIINPLLRLFVNTEPPGPTDTVPVPNRKHVAPAAHNVEGICVNVPVVMLMVSKDPTIETSIVRPVATEPLSVPLTNVPVLKSKLVANAAVGKARAKSPNNINLFIVIPR